MSNNSGQFSTFQLFDENKPGPTQSLNAPFNKSSKKPRQPKPYIPNSAIAKVNMKMDSVERTLVDYMPLVSRLIEEECLSQKCRKCSTLTDSSHESFPSTPTTGDYDNIIPTDESYQLVNFAKKKSQWLTKSIDIEEYPQILVTHFFAINEYCSYPRVLDLTEYLNTFKNQHPPEYLISAMISDSSLVSPSIHLHRKNFEFFEHHYQLSLKQMRPYLAKPSIILIQAILILWEADHNMGNFSRCIERMTSAIRLSQTLNFHQINDHSSRLYQIYNKQQLGTIRKLWDLMHFRDHQISQLVNRPALLPPYEKGLCDNSLVNPGIKHQELLGQSKHSFPKYYDSFLTHCPQLANILTNITHLVSGTSSRVSIPECLRLLRQLENWHADLPNYCKYFPVCLSIEHRLNSPMITMRILCHLIMLNGKLVLLRYLLSSPSFSSERINNQIETINLTIKISHEQLQMLQHWFQFVNSQLLSIPENGIEDGELDQLMKPPFPIEYFSELGFVYLQILKNLSDRSEHKLKYVLHDYDQLIKLLNYFGNRWDGANYVVSTLECWKSKLQSSILLPKPLIQFNCDRFFRQ